ncbi:hypothetical protein TNCV_2196441 [Trichonephila clavipes]|nr:hypothetical protein TNCV_2196441 [Trichonephila clavipes]
MAWYFAKCPSESFILSSRPLQSTYSRFLSGHTRALRFSNGQKTFPECHWCSSGEASPDPIFLRLGFKKDEPLSRKSSREVRGREVGHPDHHQSILPQNWRETELNRTVIRMVLEATANDRRHFTMKNLVGLDVAFAVQGALVTTTLFILRL